MLNLAFINDFREPCRQAKSVPSDSLVGGGEFSFSYIPLSSMVLYYLGGV